MSGASRITDRVQRVVEELIQGTELELVYVTCTREGPRQYLRIFIDTEGGVTLGHCQSLSERIDLALEVEDFIPQAYILEVSSPGLDRPLKKRNDFERFAGRLVRVKTRQMLDGRKKFLGRLQSLQSETVILEGDNGERWEIPLEQISRARLEVEF